MVALARTVYSDTPDHDPAELLDIPGKQELAEHLLDNFLPTVYLRARPGARGWDPERVQRWLGHLARHLTESRTPDLAWWRLGHGLRRSTRTLVTALVTALVIGLVDGVMSVGFSGSVIGGVLDGTIVGLLAGLLFGLVRWFTYTVTGKGLRPSAVRLRIRSRPETTTWRAGPRLGRQERQAGGREFTYRLCPIPAQQTQDADRPDHTGDGEDGRGCQLDRREMLGHAFQYTPHTALRPRTVMYLAGAVNNTQRAKGPSGGEANAGRRGAGRRSGGAASSYA